MRLLKLPIHDFVAGCDDVHQVAADRNKSSPACGVRLRSHVTIDWTLRESARAGVRVNDGVGTVAEFDKFLPLRRQVEVEVRCR